jgi:hypothetical protein
MAMLGVFLVAMQLASAASKTEIKIYNYDESDPPGVLSNDEIYIKKGSIIDIAATLHVEGGSPKWVIYIQFHVYNSLVTK